MRPDSPHGPFFPWCRCFLRLGLPRVPVCAGLHQANGLFCVASHLDAADCFLATCVSGSCLGAVPYEHASKKFLLLAVGLAGACKLRSLSLRAHLHVLSMFGCLQLRPPGPPKLRSLRPGTARVQRRFFGLRLS